MPEQTYLECEECHDKTHELELGRFQSRLLCFDCESREKLAILANLAQAKPPQETKPNTSYLKRLEGQLAAQAQAEKEKHRPKNSPAMHPETPPPPRLEFAITSSRQRHQELLAAMAAQERGDLPPEDQPTPDEQPQTTGPFDFPTGKGGPDENRYAGLTEGEKDLDAAVARVFLKSIQLLPWLQRIEKYLFEAVRTHDWGYVSKAEDALKLLLEHLAKNGGVK